MKQLLFITPFAQKISGPDESLLQLLSGLDRQKYQAHVWLPPSNPHIQRYQATGAKIIAATTPYIRRQFNPLYWLRFYWQQRRAIQQLCQLQQQQHFALIHSNIEVVLFGAIAARRLRVKHIMHVRGTSFHRPAWLGRCLVNFIEKNSSHIICISQAVAQLFSAKAKLSVLYNPLDERFFATPRQTSAPVWRQAAKYVVASAGRINPRKDFITYLKAAALVCRQRRDVLFLVVGEAVDQAEAGYLAQLHALVATEQISSQVIFTGHLDDMSQLYPHLDIFCLTSISEGFGRVLAEAQAMGVALIGTAVGGITEIIEDRISGRLVPVGDATGLSQAILQFLDDPATMQRLAQAGKNRALQRYRQKPHVVQIEKIYESVMQ